MKTVGGYLRRAGACLGVLALAGCTLPSILTQAGGPYARPQEPIVVNPIVTPSPSEASIKLSTYYQRLQNDLLARGLMRTDGGGPDTPFTDTQLARNFVQIALFDEYVADGDRLRARETASLLRRWDKPVRIDVEFGASVDPARQLTDRTVVQDYAERLGRITGHPISVVETDANFHVLFLGEDDRLAAEGQLRQLMPGIANSSLRAMLEMPRDQLCIVVAFSNGSESSYSRAVAIIRNEHPDMLRLSCVHEELAQGLGLANDSPRARPSIFNDDEEFGLLTTHDELLLKMLYDNRLRIGMDATQAAPIAGLIATELTGGGNS